MDTSTTQQLIEIACHHQAQLAQFLAWVLALVGGSSIAAWYKQYMPPWLATLIDALALNWMHLARGEPNSAQPKEDHDDHS